MLYLYIYQWYPQQQGDQSGNVFSVKLVTWLHTKEKLSTLLGNIYFTLAIAHQNGNLRKKWCGKFCCILIGMFVLILLSLQQHDNVWVFVPGNSGAYVAQL